jgi:sec-independent protein translocase protein TatA
MTTLAGILGPIGTPELLVILALGLLIFGRRLPEVGRSLGRGIVEFRRGLSGIENEIDEAANRPAGQPPKQELPPHVAQPPLTSGGEDVRISRGNPAIAEPPPQA